MPCAQRLCGLGGISSRLPKKETDRQNRQLLREGTHSGLFIHGGRVRSKASDTAEICHRICTYSAKVDRIHENTLGMRNGEQWWPTLSARDRRAVRHSVLNLAGTRGSQCSGPGGNTCQMLLEWNYTLFTRFYALSFRALFVPLRILFIYLS